MCKHDNRIVKHFNNMTEHDFLSWSGFALCSGCVVDDRRLGEEDLRP